MTILVTDSPFYLSIHLSAVSDFIPGNEIFICWELEQHRLEYVIIDLILIIQHRLIRIGCEDLADKVVEILQLIIAVHRTLDGYLGISRSGKQRISPILITKKSPGLRTVKCSLITSDNILSHS